jgi:hypothetical protein
MTLPMAEASAVAAPLTPENIMLATMLTTARPPRTRPTTIWANSTICWVRLAAFMRLPARMKNGIVSSTKLSIPAIMRWGKASISARLPVSAR